jgi:hypothetical protein
MPGRDDPEHLPKVIGTILHNECDEPSTNKADKTVLFGVIVALIFDIGQREELINLGKVNMAPLENLLPFEFIPSDTHAKIV